MIEFYGNYSKYTEDLALWMNAKQNFYIAIVVAVIFTGIFLLIAFLFHFWLIMYFEIALVAMVVITLFSPYIERKKTLQLLLPEKVIIDGGGTISIQWSDLSVVEPINNIKKILNNGGCYYMIFRHAQVRDCMIQKSMIQMGTIEEFETLFEGKIVRKKA